MKQFPKPEEREIVLHTAIRNAISDLRYAVKHDILDNELATKIAEDLSGVLGKYLPIYTIEPKNK